MAKNISKKVKDTFAQAETLAELKHAYVDAIAKFEDADKLDQLDKLYAKYFGDVKTWNRTKAGELYEKATDEVCEFFTKAVRWVKSLPVVQFEMVGSWLWVMDAPGHEGNLKASKDLRESLKGVGFRYAPKKQMWYVAPANAKRSRKHYTYAEIKAMHEDDEV